MAFAHAGRGFAHLLVDDSDSARRALDGAGLKVESETDVEILGIGRGDADRPGMLGHSARAVANADVNLRFVYLATRDRVVIGADDVEALRAAMRG